MKYPPVHYHSYLGLDKILDAQERQSEKLGHPAHDEHLFIIVHQAYELWFKQMLFELDSVLSIFKKDQVSDQEMALAVHRLSRIKEIQRLILGQIDVLETMTPLDFLEFRDFLYPASGFQSFQFRLLETKLGLKTDDRLKYNESPFYKSLATEQQQEMLKVMSETSLFDGVEKWLERTPFLQVGQYEFWKSYQTAVSKMLETDKLMVKNNPHLSEADKTRNLAMMEGTEKTFHALFDESAYNELRKQGHFRLSFKAMHAALFVQIYRDEPILQQPYNLIKSLVDIDENFTMWRYRHALMALRMLGRKVGTGGSSGHQYLKDATEKHKVFSDFFSLTTFFLPRSQVPHLPPELVKKMRFQ